MALKLPATPSDSTVIGLAVFLTVLQVVAVAIRFYARRRDRMTCGMDDYLILAASVRAHFAVLCPVAPDAYARPDHFYRVSDGSSNRL